MFCFLPLRPLRLKIFRAKPLKGLTHALRDKKPPQYEIPINLPLSLLHIFPVPSACHGENAFVDKGWFWSPPATLLCVFGIGPEPAH